MRDQSPLLPLSIHMESWHSSNKPLLMHSDFVVRWTVHVLLRLKIYCDKSTIDRIIHAVLSLQKPFEMESWH